MNQTYKQTAIDYKKKVADKFKRVEGKRREKRAEGEPH